MDTVQALRRRAQANGSLQSNDQYSVQQHDSGIAVYPAQPQVVYVPYYNPYVVYGPWWWPAYRPVFWRPWYARPTHFVSSPVFFVRSVDWHRRQVVRHVVHHAPAARPIHQAPAHQANAGWHSRREQSRQQPPQQHVSPQQPQLQWHRHLPQQQWHQQQAQQQHTRQPTQQQQPRQQQPQQQRREQRPAAFNAPGGARPMLQSTQNAPRAAAIARQFGHQDRRAGPSGPQQQRRQVSQNPQRRG
jgi:hypothetical protein